MRVIGIVAEYNPLHNGHIYHMEESKKQAGADFCVVAMSGNFVQRGEPACTDKFTRAEWAVMGGADIVTEIPTAFAVSSAERFAQGAVMTLAATGVVTDLAFGVETDDINALYHLADLLDREPANFRVDELAILGQPNNILAVEYLKSLRRYAPNILPLPIQRIGNKYNSTVLTGKLSSATAIREALLGGDESVYDTMPMSVAAAMRFDSQFPVTFDRFAPMLLYRLRTMSLEELKALPDVTEGFEQVLYRAARQATDLPSLLEAIKSKRYTLARCKRILVCARRALRQPLSARSGTQTHRPRAALRDGEPRKRAGHPAQFRHAELHRDRPRLACDRCAVHRPVRIRARPRAAPRRPKRDHGIAPHVPVTAIPAVTRTASRSHPRPTQKRPVRPERFVVQSIYKCSVNIPVRDR